MLRSLLVLAIFVPGTLLALTSRYRALLLYLWCAFFRPQEWAWSAINNLRMSLVAALILVVPALFTGVFPNLTHPLSIGAVLFLLSGLLAQTNAVNQALGWEWIEFFARLTLICSLAVTLIRTPRDLMRVIAVAAGCIAFFATKAGLLSLALGGTQFAEGLAGAFVDNNAYALVTVMILPMLIALAQNAQLTFEGLVPEWTIRWIRRGLYLSVPLCVYTVVSTFSRAGFLALVAAALFFIMLHPRRIRFAMMLIPICGLAFLVPLPKGYVDRVASIQDVQRDNPEEDASEGRLHFWGLAVRMAERYPLGVGMRNFESQFASFDTLEGAYGRNRDVHSSHFQVLAEQGYLGVVIWTGQFIYAFCVAWRVRRRSRTPGLSPAVRTFMETISTALMVSMVGFLVGGSFVSSALNDLTWLTFALLASLDLLSARLCVDAREQHPAESAVLTPVSALTRTGAPRGRDSVGVGIGQPRRQQ